MNLPNKLTCARFVLTLCFVAALSSNLPLANTLGMIFFALAGMTDYADGEIARRYNLVTDFGKLMDPLADKIMVAAAFVCLVAEGAFPPWVAIIVVSREFLITGLRLLAASKGRVLAAESVGKHKTVWQIVMVLFFLALKCLEELANMGLLHKGAWWWHAWTFGGAVLIAITLILTLYSGFSYLWRNREMIEGA